MIAREFRCSIGWKKVSFYEYNKEFSQVQDSNCIENPYNTLTQQARHTKPSKMDVSYRIHPQEISGRKKNKFNVVN